MRQRHVVSTVNKSMLKSRLTQLKNQIMPSTVDPAILAALSLSPHDASIQTHGYTGFASSFRITTPTTSVFVKTSPSKSAATMFEGEHASLNAIHDAVPSLCPKSFAWGKLEAASGYFLATEFLDMGAGTASGGSGMSLAEKLAKLHSTPPPDEFKDKGFGFPVSTCCGDTVQDNSWRPTWAEFFGECRMLHILKCAEANNGVDQQLRQVVEDTVEKVVPRLLGEGHLGGKEGVKPVVTHGDLWSGNKGRASFAGRDDGGPSEDVVFDPSAAYCHSEWDHGIMNMFGGFSGSFWKEYWKHLPKTEPADEYEDRVALYQSYHQLNHYSIFGGGYKSGAMSILRRLLKKYG